MRIDQAAEARIGDERSRGHCATRAHDLEPSHTVASRPCDGRDPSQRASPGANGNGRSGVGANRFSLRRLAKALGVGPTTIHFHFEGGVGAVSSAVAQQALAGVTRPFKPKEEPAAYLAELLLKIMEALHARPVVAKLVVLQLSSNPILEPLLAERLLLALAALGVPTIATANGRRVERGAAGRGGE